METKHLKWDYWFNPEKGLLYRAGLNESAHLMWQFKGIPMFNAEILAANPSVWLGAKTNKRRFSIARETFEKNKKEWKNGKETQYYCDKSLWTIEELSPTTPQDEKKPQSDINHAKEPNSLPVQEQVANSPHRKVNKDCKHWDKEKRRCEAKKKCELCFLKDVKSA